MDPSVPRCSNVAPREGDGPSPTPPSSCPAPLFPATLPFFKLLSFLAFTFTERGHAAIQPLDQALSGRFPDSGEGSGTRSTGLVTVREAHKGRRVSALRSEGRGDCSGSEVFVGGCWVHLNGLVPDPNLHSLVFITDSL